LQFYDGLTLVATKISDSLLSEDILEREFTKMLSTVTFDYYSVASDPAQHIRHFRDKMVVYSRTDALICLSFPFSLKGVTSD